MCRRVNGRGIKYCCFTPPGNRRYTKCRIPSEFFSNSGYYMLSFSRRRVRYHVCQNLRYSGYVSLSFSRRRVFDHGCQNICYSGCFMLSFLRRRVGCASIDSTLNWFDCALVEGVDKFVLLVAPP